MNNINNTIKELKDNKEKLKTMIKNITEKSEKLKSK